MEKDRSSKTVALVALVVAVVGLSVGFAAFSNQLVIKSSATVSPENTFSVVFSKESTDVLDGETNKVVAEVSDADDVTATDAVIDNSTSTPTITGLSATFNNNGGTATYSFYAYNASEEYTAYLKKVAFATVTGKTSSIVCTAKEGTTQSLVDAACTDISYSIKIGSEDAYTSTTELTTAKATAQSIAITDSTPVVVTISYVPGEDSVFADGDFTVAFGDITLTYSSTAN